MENNSLHIISFNVPLPADYGGVIDVFYRLKALSELGVKIHLHCFEYGRGISKELEMYCDKVSYYKRDTSFSSHFSTAPFIVKSRDAKKLLNNLCVDNAPILFEGIHTCYYLDSEKLKNRIKIVRAHNIEHTYYKLLRKKTSNLKKKIFFAIESVKLRFFEKKLSCATHILAISPNDYNYFKSKYKSCTLILPGHPNDEVRSTQGEGSYALYHGNLSIAENLEAAKFIIQNIAPLVKQKIIIAGKDPSNQLFKLANNHLNIEIIANPTDELMSKLITNAHVNLCITFQPTGFKLKLINALFNGRFCIANNIMIENTGMEELCVIANNTETIADELIQHFEIGFSEIEIDKRREILNDLFSNKKNAETFIRLVYN